MNPDAEFLLGVSGQVLLARCLCVAAEYGIADRLAREPRSAEELAAELDLHADSLYRVLRMLASHDVFAEDTSRRFRLTPRAELLCKDQPGSLRPLLARGWQDLAWDTFRELPDAVRRGDVAFERAHGQAFFDYLAAHPAASAAFDGAMALSAAAENPVVAAALDLTGIHRVADIGGGQGGLLAALPRRQTGLQAVLVDQPQVIANPVALQAPEFARRCEFTAADFFASVPSGADLYLLKRILHDWDDDNAVQILKNCRAALPAHGRLVVIEAVMAPGNNPDPNKALDVSIMALTRGRERTAGEFGELFVAAGLELVSVTSLPAPATLSLVEARASAG